MGIIFFELALTGYFIAAVISVIDLCRSRSESAKLTIWLMAAGFALHTAAIVSRYACGGYLPTMTLHEAASLFAWCISLIFFLLIAGYRIRVFVFVSFIAPIVFLVMSGAAFMSRAAAAPDTVLQNPWLLTHAVCAFTGIAAFAVAAGTGIMYLVQHYALKTKRIVALSRCLPGLQVIDEINHRLVTLGFALFTAALITGALRAAGMEEGFWKHDPKTLWSLVTWLIYALCFLLRHISGWKQRRAAILSIIGFAAVLFTFFGVNLLLNTLHPFK
jgi:cytochrome c-type biogenesis protein CcsB